MKLRIRGNSLRLRLQQGEVAKLAADGRVEERTAFGPNQVLVYSVEEHDADEIAIVWSPDEICVRLPAQDVALWASSDQVGFEAFAENGEGGLRILVEKDFTCLTPRAGEDDVDAYPNPARAGEGE